MKRQTVVHICVAAACAAALYLAGCDNNAGTAEASTIPETAESTETAAGSAESGTENSSGTESADSETGAMYAKTVTATLPAGSTKGGSAGDPFAGKRFSVDHGGGNGVQMVFGSDGTMTTYTESDGSFAPTEVYTYSYDAVEHRLWFAVQGLYNGGELYTSAASLVTAYMAREWERVSEAAEDPSSALYGWSFEVSADFGETLVAYYNLQFAPLVTFSY